MWALGVMLYQFFSNKLPFYSESDIEHELVKQITESDPALLPSTISPFINEIIS
jgi:serine/threonine protein kinase